MDAMVIRHLSRLCRQQAEQLSANINQFRQEGVHTVDMFVHGHESYLCRVRGAAEGCDEGGPGLQPQQEEMGSARQASFGSLQEVSLPHIDVGKSGHRSTAAEGRIRLVCLHLCISNLRF